MMALLNCCTGILADDESLRAGVSQKLFTRGRKILEDMQPAGWPVPLHTV
jgi:hypothetical protein